MRSPKKKKSLMVEDEKNPRADRPTGPERESDFFFPQTGKKKRYPAKPLRESRMRGMKIFGQPVFWGKDSSRGTTVFGERRGGTLNGNSPPLPSALSPEFKLQSNRRL